MPVERERKQEREAFLNTQLAPTGIPLAQLAPPTVTALHSYARFVLGSGRHESAVWNPAVVELCRAAEAQIAVTLGSRQGLGELAAPTPLGAKARALRNYLQEPLARQVLAATSRADEHELFALFTQLHKQVEELAILRQKSGAAHGGHDQKDATEQDTKDAWALVADKYTGILPLVVRLGRALRPGQP